MSSMEMKIDFFESWVPILGDLLAICKYWNYCKISKKLKNMAKNQPTIDAFMDRRWSSEYHFLSKLYNKLLHRPTNDVVNFRGRGWVECACIRWERSRKRTHHESCRVVVGSSSRARVEARIRIRISTGYLVPGTLGSPIQIQSTDL